MESATNTSPADQKSPLARLVLAFGTLALASLADYLLQHVWTAFPGTIPLVWRGIAWPGTPWILVVVLTIAVLVFMVKAALILDDEVQAHRKTNEQFDAMLDKHEAFFKEADDDYNALENRFDVFRRLLRLDGNILWSIENLVFESDVPKSCNRLIKVLLADTAHILSDLIFRCYVLQPSGDKLVTYVTYQMPEPEDYCREFYIGADESRRRGVAGHAYTTRTIQVAKRVDDPEEPGKIRFDHPEFVSFTDHDPPAQYRAIVCIPIVPSPNICLGVLCLDSEDETAFDSESSQEFLFGLGVLIGILLQISARAESHKKATIDIVSPTESVQSDVP